MFPVTQKNSTQGEGDCFPASIASILEIPLELFPTENCKEWNAYHWRAWLIQHGLILYGPSRNSDVYYEGYWIGIVRSVNHPHCYHALVMENDKLAWDPNCAKKYEHVDLNDVTTAWLVVLSDVTKFRRFLEQAEASRRPLDV